MSGAVAAMPLAVSALGALLSLSAVAAAMASRRRASKEIQTRLSRSDLRGAVNADALAQLGQYLDEVMGNVTLYEYTRNEAVRRRALRDIGQLSSYAVDGSGYFLDDAAGRFRASARFSSQAVTSEEFVKIGASLNAGEVWNALARLRRLIEVELREVGAQHGFSPGRLSAARLVERMAQADWFLDQSHARDLAAVIATCNRAIHGIDVSDADARAAVERARDLMALLESLPVEPR